MTKKPALFISKTSALRAIVVHGKRKGVPIPVLVGKAKTLAVYSRGEIQGYIAMLPNREGIRSPIMEA